MIDIGLSKLMIIGVVALVVIGPEKLPRVARTAGTLFGRAQRYVNDVKAEVTQQMNLDEINKMKRTVEEAARNVEASVAKNMSDTNKEIEDVWKGASEAKPTASPASPDSPTPHGAGEPFTPQKPATGTLTNLTPKPADATYVQTPSILQAHAQAKIRAMDVAAKKEALRKKREQHALPWRSQRAATPLWYKRRSRIKSTLRSSAAKHAGPLH